MWTIGAVVAVILFPAISALLLVGAQFAKRWQQEADDYDEPFARAIKIGGRALAGVILVAVLLAMYPYSAEYHQWREHSGVVAAIDSRLVGKGETKYVVTFSGNPQQYGVLDTRVASVRVGDKLTITCVRQYQEAGTDGYDCEFVALEK